MANKRSEPGKGDTIAIYVLGPDELCDGDSIMGYGRSAICASTGEDFSDSAWPVVVKVKAKVTRDQLIQHLSDLVKAAEDGFFMEVNDEQIQGSFVSPGFERRIEDPKAEGEKLSGHKSVRLIKIFGGENAQKKAGLYALAQGLRAVPLTDLPSHMIARLGLDDSYRNSQGIQYNWAVIKE